MNANTKVLVLLAAIVAFAVGAVVNSAKVESDFSTDALINAELIKDGNSAIVADSLGKLTLVNFWASWCAPCRREMPMFESMYRANSDKGFTVIGIAIDSPEKTQAMLDSMDISYPILYAEKTGMQLLEKTGNAQGLLPYSVLLDKDGGVVDQVVGKIDGAQIQAWLQTHL